MEKQIFIKNIELPTKKYVDDSIPSPIQYGTMPTASESLLGKIVQYTGTTDSTYTNGYFYICVSDGESTPTYLWENINVQDGGGFKEITEDTRIYTLDSGIYSVQGGVKLYYNDNINSYISDSWEYSIYVGEKTTGTPVFVPFIIYIGYRNMSYEGIKGYGQFLYCGLSTTGGNGSVRYLKVDSSYYALADNVLSKNNTSSYTPSSNYNPATKKYVDDSIASAITDALGGGY